MRAQRSSSLTRTCAGVTGFDAEGAYQILSAAAMSMTEPAAGRGGRNNVVPYMQLGYVPSSVGASVSWTLEYGQDDAALANLATALGHTSDAATLNTRRTGYTKLFDPTTQLLWSKTDAGGWGSGHSEPSAYGSDFDEANAVQSVWGPWHDMPGLANLVWRQRGLRDRARRLLRSRARPPTTPSTGPVRSPTASSPPSTGAGTSPTSTRLTSSPSPAAPT